MVVKILFVLALVFLLVYIVKRLCDYFFLKEVSKDSLIVFGKKGKGKTFFFSWLARSCHKGYASTTSFKHKNELLISYKDINTEPNSWSNVLNNDITHIEKNPLLEGKPVFLDDAGVYLPNFADSTLKKEYSSLPISFAVWRHLYNAPIHINSQDVNRCWKMVREQADGFIRVRKTNRLGPISFIHWTYYDRFASAEEEINPLRSVLFNKFSKANLEEFKAKYGVVRNGVVVCINRHHKYDSRYFHYSFFGYTAKEFQQRLSLAKRK